MRRWRPHPVDVAFVAVVAAMLVLSLSRTRGYYFVSDDLLLLQQGSSPGGFIDSYNGHLSLVPLALYRLLAEAFGLRHGPYQVIGAVALLAAPVAYYLTTRGRLGRLGAALLALALFAAGRIAFVPSELNHHLALLGAVVCAWALDRGRRADVWLGAALAFSLASAGGGVAVAVACVVHCACAGAGRRRWAAVLVPTLLWGGWALTESGGVATSATPSRAASGTPAGRWWGGRSKPSDSTTWRWVACCWSPSACWEGSSCSWGGDGQPPGWHGRAASWPGRSGWPSSAAA